MLKLDDRDIKILSILGREGRLSKAELAKRVNLSAAPAWERLKRLEDAGIITGYHASVALKKLAPHVTVFMAAELESHRAQDFQTFERALAPLDEIVACWAVGGGFDYILQIVTRDIDSYQRFDLRPGGGLDRDRLIDQAFALCGSQHTDQIETIAIPIDPARTVPGSSFGGPRMLAAAFADRRLEYHSAPAET